MGLEEARELLLSSLSQEIHDPRVLDAFARVPREIFVPPELRASAYQDGPLPVGYRQTISQPLMVAIMTEALSIQSSDNVLELGTGSGYQAAILSLLARQVTSVERIPALQERAAQVLGEIGVKNIRFVPAGAQLGYPAGAPYDGIVVTAGAPQIPPVLLTQLREGGRMVIPVGDRQEQDLLRVVRRGDSFPVENLGKCRFVPLIGPGAWSES
jgi:protein-L-isoaspartate(D-aspartate) O-methyltransferase